MISTIQTNRPLLSKSSLKTYNSVLSNLYRSITGKYDEPEVEWFSKEQDKILNYLENAPRDARKLRLSALAVLTEKDKKISDLYKQKMNMDIANYNQEQKLQKKTEKQEQNWISQEEVENVYKNLRVEIRPLLKKQKTQQLTPKEHAKIQDFVMLSLFVLNPPRRSQDYIEMKLHGKPTPDTNFIKGKKFIFNKYKTAKTYGTQEVDINPQLLYILNIWKKINPNQEWLLVGQNGNKMLAPEMTRRFNNLFGKKISVSMLRHIYISDRVLKNMPALTELQNEATDMGQSLNQQILYKKV